MREYERFEGHMDGIIAPKYILRHITHSKQLNHDRYTFIILGKVGPTGKTWLCRELRSRGFDAIELAPTVYAEVSYKDNHNHLIVDEEQNCVTIILNRLLMDFKVD